jgi:diguanylate cyclase (GGDEF)-like protein/PAS domain S-box-containing protein
MPVLILLVFLPVADAWAAAGSAEPPFRFYSVVDGLTQSDVSGIEQDRTGYLWFTTARGLNRYDGSEFEQYTIAHGLPSNELTVLHVDADNAVWVGDARGNVSVIRDNRVAEVVRPISTERTPISDIETIDRRLLVVAEGAGILEMVADGQGYRFESIGGQSIGVTELVVADGAAWAIAASGMYRLTFEPEFELQQVSKNIRLAHVAADGTLWVADKDNRIGTWKDGVFELRALIDAEYVMVDIATCSSGIVWAATQDGLFSFDGTQPGRVQSADAIRRYDSVPSIWTLFVDRENTLWFSGRSGLARFQGDRFRHFKLKTGPEAEVVWSISEDARGRLWFGTETKLLVREADETLTVVGPDRGIPSGTVRDLVHSAAGDLWLGVLGEGLFLIQDGSLQGELIAATAGHFILDIAIAPDHAIWYSTLASGVFRYIPGTGSLESYPPFGDRGVYSLDISADGSVWYGAVGIGLVRLVPKGNGEYQQEFYAAGPGMGNAWYSHVRLTGEREAWLAADEGGLYRFEAGVYTDFGTDSPWADQTVYLVEALDNGTLVVGGEQGLYQLVPGSPQIAHYGRFDGFIGVETNAHATFTDSRNFLWIGTVDGVTRMNVAQPMPDYSEPVPRILSIETELDRIAIEESTVIEPGQLGVQIEFAAVSLSRPKAIDYSYKLVGINDEWGAATSNRSVNYSGIPPGSYEFMVRARYQGGDWSRQYATHRFAVAPFVWQRTWFRLSFAVSVLLALWGVMIYRTRRIKKLNTILRAEVADRTKSIEKAKHNLQLSNEKLSREIRERQKAERARMAVEARFRRAFENVPIGIGLLDADGRLFDTNPALRNMIYSNSSTVTRPLFSDAIEAGDRERFIALYEKLATSEIDGIEENIRCISAGGEVLQMAVSLSAVKSDQGDLYYSVLQVQDITESRRLTDQLEYHASYDDLTGLLNRRSYESELARAWEKVKVADMSCYLLYMDLDQFKVVNDTSGHAAGDQLLRRVSEIVRSVVRVKDTVCRLGGDEFGVILWDCSPDVAYRIAESIRTGIENLRFQWDSQTYRVGVSIGGMQIDPDCNDVAELQQLADSACYAAKEAGRNRVHMVAGLNDSARIHRGQIRWVQRLREAMDNNRFEIFCQVIAPLRDDAHEPERHEITLQLRDSETGKLIPPSAFLPAAERYGLSIELDQWVVRNLLRAISAHSSLRSEPRQYWINLSGTSIGDTRFADFLMDAIGNSTLPSGTINFEIAETAVIRRVVETGELMSMLREMGCRFALDDFGSALSSFDYLKKLPVDCLKIDGSFVRNLLRDKTDQVFVRSIIDIAHALDMQAVVALVDNEELLTVVRQLGADFAQGLAIGKPSVLITQDSCSAEFEHAVRGG